MQDLDMFLNSMNSQKLLKKFLICFINRIDKVYKYNL